MLHIFFTIIFVSFCYVGFLIKTNSKFVNVWKSIFQTLRGLEIKWQMRETAVFFFCLCLKIQLLLLNTNGLVGQALTLIAFMTDVLVCSDTIIFLVLKYHSFRGFHSCYKFWKCQRFGESKSCFPYKYENNKTCVKCISIRQDGNNVMQMTLPALSVLSITRTDDRYDKW